MYNLSMQNLVRLLIFLGSCGLIFPLTAQNINPLGAAINSEFNEIHPLISADGQTLYFVRANHPSNGMGKEGSNDVWYAEKRGTQWTMSRRMPNAINKDRYNDLFSISPDGQTALIRGVYEKGKRIDEVGLSTTTKNRNGWSQPEKVNIPKLDGMVKGPYLSAYLGHDGRTLLLSFSESKTGSEDLYVSLQDRKGQWSKPLFLGKEINTSFGETTPFLASDQMTLYFASNRPGGQGGYDIWMSRRRDRTWQKWTKPINLGEKINSKEDDLYFSIAADGVSGYLSTRNNSVGKGDIMLIQFPQPEITTPTLAQTGAVQGGSSQTGDNSTNSTDKNTNRNQEGLGPDGSNSLAATRGNGGKNQDRNVSGNRQTTQSDGSTISGNQGGTNGNNSGLFDGATPAPVIMYAGKVIQEKTGQPLDAKIIYESLNGDGTSGVVSTNPTTGEYKLLLPVGKSYAIRAEAKDFVSSSQRLDLTQTNQYTEIKAVTITAVQLVSGANITLENIFFEFGKATLQPTSTVELNRIVDLLLDNPTLIVEIQGHTDNVGTNEVNKKLSQDRADAVRTYLLRQKVPADRITSKGYGFDRPIASNETPEGQAKNRRVDFLVIRK